MNEQQPATSSELPEPPLRIMRRIHVRAALVALFALVAIGSGTAYAATRTTSHPIGTGVVVIETNLAYQNEPRRARGSC